MLEHADLVTRTARSLAKRLPPSVELDDLIGAGTVGLLSAASRYRAGAVPFPAFAQQRVRGAMLDAIRADDWVPRSIRRAGGDIGRMCVMQESYRNVPDGRESPLDLIAHRELRACVVGAVQALPDRERALVARCVVGYVTKRNVYVAVTA